MRVNMAGIPRSAGRVPAYRRTGFPGGHCQYYPFERAFLSYVQTGLQSNVVFGVTIQLRGETSASKTVIATPLESGGSNLPR